MTHNYPHTIELNRVKCVLVGEVITDVDGQYRRRAAVVALDMCEPIEVVPLFQRMFGRSSITLRPRLVRRPTE